MSPNRGDGELIGWDLAERVARRSLGFTPSLPIETFLQVQADFTEATARAEELVAEVTGLVTSAGPVQAIATDRAGWVHANLGSFRRLLQPVTTRLLESSPRAGRSELAREAAGVEVGLLLAWISSRVLGQYDLLPGEETTGDDAIYYVAPNIVALERRHGFSPREFRLWIAVHEVTHRLQFTGVPWMREHFLDLVQRGTNVAPPDAHAILESVRRAAGEIRQGRNPLAEGGVVGLIASSEQLATLHEAQALMSLLEGQGDVVMATVGRDHIPGAARFAKVLAERRSSASGPTKLVQQLLGMEAKIRQYRDGELFVEAVLEEGGEPLFRRLWEGPEMLPSMPEVRDPAAWVARVGARSPA
jgi:coenzyme F420 biosynthesis associated uncharacterized protein